MIRMNITIPDDIGKELSHIRNKSHFIAQTLREKFTAQRKKMTEDLLAKSYKKAAQEDGAMAREWDAVSGDGIDG